MAMNKNYTKARNRSNLRIFSGSSHHALSKSVARKCGVTLGQLNLTKFSNNETSVDLQENVRGQDIYLIQTGGGAKPNDDLMELLFLINSFKLSSADVINVIIPYFFYSKGDQKDSHKRVPITAKLVTSLLKRAGADHVMIIEPHTPQLEGFFETPVDALKVEPLFCEWIRKNIKDWHEYIVVAPDEGSVKRCTSVANDLNLDFALINNRRPSNKTKSVKPKAQKRVRNLSEATVASSGSGKPPSLGQLREQKSSERELEGESDTKESMISEDEIASEKRKISHHHQHRHKKISVSGSVSGRRVIVVDDMIDTGHTLKDAIETLKKFGAISVTVLATHGLFSGNSMEIIKEHSEYVKRVVVSNTVPQVKSKEELGDHLEIIDVSGLIAEYIRRHHYCESVQVLCHYMPLRDAEISESETESQEESVSEEDEIAFDLANLQNLELLDDNQLNGEGAVAAANAVNNDGNQARDLRLMHLRKGFRLSSMCWDD